MHCKHCGKEIPEESLFCNRCGKTLEESNNINSVENGTLKDNKGKSLNKKTIVYGLLGGTLVLVILFFVFNNNPVNDFMQSINDDKHSEAVSIYNEKISGDIRSENEIKEKLNQEMNNIVKSFENKNSDYERVKVQLDTIKKTNLINNEANNAIKNVNELNDSRIAFNKGLEFKTSKDYIDSIIQFRKVIETDQNYESAQDNIDEISSIYKDEILKEIDILANEKKYEEIIKKVKQALKALPSSEELKAKLSNYEKLAADEREKELQEKIIKLEEEQEVAVIKINEYTNTINTNFIGVTVENRTDKTVKSYSIGFMGFDKNNLPIKVGLAGGDFVGRGRIDQNILPGESKNSGGGWYLDNHDVVTLLACIYEVEYYEGAKWKNPYYDIWLEKYEEKPLK